MIKEFDGHFVPKKNIIYERARFRNRVQNSGENVETFVRSLYELSEYCNFGDAKDANIRDSIVIGLLDNQVSQQLQMESSLTLTKAIEKARHAELVKSQNVVSPPMSDGATCAVNAVRTRPGQPKGNKRNVIFPKSKMSQTSDKKGNRKC